MRVVILGNAGSGKSTMARRLAAGRDIPVLSLDAIAFAQGAERRPLGDSLAALQNFLDTHDSWIIEGCYGDIAAAALPHCTELRFLNPGVETCVAHCEQRPWEPDKFASQAEQNAVLPGLIDWVRSYETRDDEYGLECHRRVFTEFAGLKREYSDTGAYDDDGF
ncbi:shikimate kinase [Elongatibacter sediminis]|uniref:Shikimate kinase n=1 Tax=Elongatibacter sediminis TaxID=3119006 RepID=A0AAW9R6S4_9GAMM